MSSDHNMHQKSTTLELAERLRGYADYLDFDGDLMAAFFELRRLQADNEAKDALLRQALEALETDWEGCLNSPQGEAIAAIKEHLK